MLGDEGRLQDNAHRIALALLGLQVRITGRGEADTDATRTGAEGGDTAGAKVSLATVVVGDRIGSRIAERVGGFQVRSAEALLPGAAEADTIDHVPGDRDLGLRHRTEVAVVLEAAGQLDVDATDQRDVHVRRNQRQGELDEGRADITRALGAGRVVDAGDVAVAGRAGHRVSEGGATVQLRVAAVLLGLVTEFHAGGDTDIARPYGQQVRLGDLEVGQGQGRGRMALQAEADGVQRGLGAGRAVPTARAVEATAVEGVVGVGGRQGQLSGQLLAVDAVAFVLGVSLGVEQRRVPAPAPLLALQPAQEAGLVVLDLNLARTQVVEAVVGEGHWQAGRRHVGQVRQAVRIGLAVGEGHRAEGVPVVAGRHANHHQACALGRQAFRGRVIEAELAIGRQRVADVVVAVQEQVLALDLWRDGRRVVLRGVVAVGIGGAASRQVAGPDAKTVTQLGGAAGDGVGLDVGRSGRRGQGRRTLTDHAGAAKHREVGERVLVATVVRRGAGRVLGITGEQRTQVLCRGIGPVAGTLGRAPGEIAVQRDVAPPLREVAAGEDVAAVFLAVRALGPAVLSVDRQAVEIVLQDCIDHAGHRVRAVDGGGAVAQHFQAIQVRGGDGVGVVAQQRHGARRLAGWVRNQAAPVQQHQGVAHAQAAQVDRIDVAARGVAGLRRVAGIDEDIAHLRDRAEQVIARDGAGGGDLAVVQHRDRQSGRGLGAADLAANHDDFLDLGRVGVLGRGGAGGGEQADQGSALDEAAAVAAKGLVRHAISSPIYSCSDCA